MQDLPISVPQSSVQKSQYETQRVNNDLQALYKIRPANDTCTKNEYSSCDVEIYTGATDRWYEEKFHSDPEQGYNGDPVIVSNLDQDRRFVKNFTVLDDKHFNCKTQWFSVDLSYEVFSKNVGWAHPLLVKWPEYGAGPVDSGATLCLECYDSWNGCGPCNGCYNTNYACKTSCTAGCTENCTTGCTESCTTTATDNICLGNTSAMCETGEVSVNPDCKTSVHDDGGGCPNCHDQDLTEGPEDCKNNTAETCNCQTNCFAGCTSQCDGCTSQIQTSPEEDIKPVCGGCNNCTDCTLCVGTDSGHCPGTTTCATSCTLGCTTGMTDRVPECPNCVNSCTSECQNNQNGLGDGRDACFGSNVTTFTGCNTSGVSCGAGEVSCMMNTLFFRCTGNVELCCPNNNAGDYDASLCIEDFDDGCSASENGGTFKCPIQIDACGQMVTCKGNCNTGDFSGWYCTSAAVSILKPSDECKNGEFSPTDSIERTCGEGCDSSCAAYCTTGCTGNCTAGCTTGCVTSCFGCTTGCTSGCTTGCTRSCTTGCTQGTSSPCSGCTSGCTSSCVRGCTSSCASGCTSGCFGACTTGCTSGCTTGCTSGCTTGCTGNCVDHGSTCTSCVSSCTTGCQGSATGCTCLGCTSGCTDGCTTGHLCYFWQ